MKSLAELKAIRDKSKILLKDRCPQEDYRIVLAMATCGISAGARPVMSALLEEIHNQSLTNVIVTQTGCAGMCGLEPMMNVFNPEGEKVTYVKLTAEKAKRIIQEHIKNNSPVLEYTIDSEQI